MKKTTEKKTLQTANLTDDFLFCKVMLDPVTCKAVLEEILGFKIKSLVVTEAQKTISPGYESKGIRLDVLAIGEDGNVYDIEMQNIMYPEIPKRSRYYHSVMDVEEISKGTDYSELPKSYVIFIVPVKIFDGTKMRYTFKNYCEEDKSLELGDETYKIFLSTKGKEQNISKELLAFCKYIENTTNEEALLSDSKLVKIVHQRVLDIRKDTRLGGNI